MAEEQYIVQCSHCGNKTPQKRLKSVPVHDEIELEDGRKFDYPVTFSLWQCSTCEGVSLYVRTPDDDVTPDDTYFDVATLVYPDEKKLESVVPEVVRRSYLEARKVKQISRYAFAVLIRRALEQICLEQDASGNSLKAKIDDLARQDIIPKNLARMAEALRFLGNLGAHAMDYKFGFQEVEAMDEFLVAVIEYVYVAPQKVQNLAESIREKQEAQKTSN